MSDQGGTSDPGWYPDPYGRHEHRYWDGSAWSDQVSDGGATSSDPPTGDVAPTQPSGATVAQPVLAPGAVAAGGLPPSPAPEPKKKTPVALLAILGVVVAAVVVFVLLQVLGGDDSGGGSVSGTLDQDNVALTQSVDMDAGEVARVIVHTDNGVDARVSVAAEPDVASTQAFLSLAGGTDVDESNVQEAYVDDYDSVLSDAVSDSDLSSDISQAFSDDYSDFSDRVAEASPELAEAGVVFDTTDNNGEGDDEAYFFLAPVAGKYAIVVTAVGGSSGDVEGTVETEGPADSFDESDFNPDENIHFKDYLEQYGEHRDFLCDADFYGDNLTDIDPNADQLCDEDTFQELLSTDFSGDLTSDFSTDTSTDFSTDFSTDTSTDFSTDSSTDDPIGVPALGDPIAPATFIPDYGSNPQFDADADACFGGDLAACDNLYAETPISPDFNSYEGYGNSCGGRLPEEFDGDCVDLS